MLIVQNIQWHGINIIFKQIIGTCEEIKESSLGKIIGWLIVIGVLGFGVWFYLKKYKKVKSVNDLMAFMKRKQ